jgi:4-hydroxybenzoate polyprenyltransferase
MIARVRLLVVLARPAALILFAMCALLGQARAGASNDPARLGVVLVIVFAFVLCSVACNDLADERIDRVNLATGSRPLVTGMATRRDLRLVAAVAAAVALGVGGSLGPVPFAVTAAGLALGVAYSLPPVRIADRGAIASLTLPACYVGVPYLLGYTSAGVGFDAPAALTLAGLYLGFVARLLLKDFRDVRGDAMFGKRTFLVRHGRRVTCAVSAVAWVSGTALLVLATPDPGFAAATAVLAVATVGLVRRLALETHPRREELLVSALAVLGRGTLLNLLAELGVSHALWSQPATAVLLAALTASTLGAAGTMLRRGPSGRLVLCIGPVSRASSDVRMPASRP